jgi:hypothetical protein
MLSTISMARREYNFQLGSDAEGTLSLPLLTHLGPKRGTLAPSVNHSTAYCQTRPHNRKGETDRDHCKTQSMTTCEPNLLSPAVGMHVEPIHMIASQAWAREAI